MVVAPDPGNSRLIHATAIALDGRAALLMGPSGAGKSDLALRCLMLEARDGGLPLRAVLVADDQVRLELQNGSLNCLSPPTIAGHLEVRGLGIMRMPFVASARVVLAVRLASNSPIERMPDPATLEILGCTIPEIRLSPFEASAPAKLLLALARST